MFHLAFGVAAFDRGDWSAARSELTTGLELVAAAGGRGDGQLFARAVLAVMAVHAGDRAGADEQLVWGHAALEEHGPGLGTDLLRWAEAMARDQRGDEVGAWQTLQLAWELGQPARYFLSWRHIAPDAVRMSLRAGRLDRAADVVDIAVAGAMRAGSVRSAVAAADQCRGLFQRDAELLLGAANSFGTSGRLLAAASCLFDAADVLERAGWPDKAVDAIREAIAVFDTVGAAHDSARLRARLRRLGVRLRPSEPVNSPGHLTPTEQRVVDFIVEGLTTREIAERLFISHHTVTTHVRHVYRKLGVSSRLELAARMRRLTGGRDGPASY